MTFIDRLERRFGWIAVPGVVKIIVAFQALIWLLNIFRENDLAFHLLLFLDKDLIICLGAGSITKIANSLEEELKNEVKHI